MTVVDHLGTVSSNLEQRVYGGNKISKTEQRIDCLNQVREFLNKLGI